MGLSNALVQICIVGLLAFCGPGLFNALNGLGAVGSGDPTVAAITNGCLYSTFAVVGYFAGSIFNIIGPKIAFSAGGASYAIYALCVYFSSVHVVFPAIGGVQLGVGAGIFWCAQMALTIAYSTAENKGTMMSIFWAIFNLGGVFGGFLQMGLNWSKVSRESGGLYAAGSGSANPAAYFSFIGIMAFACILPPLLLVDPKEVIKEDGSSVVVQEAQSFKAELKAAVKGIADPFVVRMFVYFFFSNWFYTYEFNYLNSHFFNSRGQGMNSGLYWGAQMLGACVLPLIVDKASWTLKKRATGGAILNLIMFLVSWAMAITAQFVSCNGVVDKESGAHFMEPPYYGLNNNMAWFPNVCDNHRSNFEKQGLTCNDGCDFLANCRLAVRPGRPHMPDNTFPYDITYTVCDQNFPRCAVPDSGETAKCNLDISMASEEFVCSNSTYQTFPQAFFESIPDGTVLDDTKYTALQWFLDGWNGQVVLNELSGSGIDWMDAEATCGQFSKGRPLVDLPFEPAWPPWTMPEVDVDYDTAMANFKGIWTAGTQNEQSSLKICSDFGSTFIGSPLCQVRGDECEASDAGKALAAAGKAWNAKAPFKLDRNCIKIEDPGPMYAAESALVIVTYIMMGVSDAIFQVFVLWMIGAFSHGDLALSARYAAAYKGIQSAGAAVSWFADLSDDFTYKIQAYVCVALGVLAMVGSFCTIPIMSSSIQRCHSMSIMSFHSGPGAHSGPNMTMEEDAPESAIQLVAEDSIALSSLSLELSN